MTEIQKVIDEAEVVGSEHGYVWRSLVLTTIPHGKPGAVEVAP